MKLSNLAIIFLIIVIPIAIVLSEYINNRIKVAETELEYNSKLSSATYDAIKAFQINTINNAFGDVTNSKISDIEDAVFKFYNSLTNNFNFTGYKSSVMKEYVPAIAFTLYDGYYIYSPFNNTLTGIDTSKTDTNGNPVEYDKDYSKPDEITNGLKPYIYYSVRYVNPSNNWDFVITYTLDNYITIMGQIGYNNYVYDCGYLYSITSNKGESDQGKGIYKNGNNYYFGGVEFKEDDTEVLKEYIGDTEYPYAKINGKKYYLETNEASPIKNVTYKGSNLSFNIDSRIFYIDDKGAKNYSQVKKYDDLNSDSEKEEFYKYYLAITKNKSAYIYYKKAYEFSSAVLGSAVSDYKDKAGVIQTGYNLIDLKASDSLYYKEDANELKKSGITPLTEYGDFTIFKDNDGKCNMHLDGSNFNKHRKSIIRYVVETNTATAISGFSSNSNKQWDDSTKKYRELRKDEAGYTEYIMPKISETDWNIIQNDVCAISFLQGLKMGTKTYNGYSVVANTLTKEYIDENDIYILTTDNTYCKANDGTFTKNNGNNIRSKLDYYSGIWKINFERTKYTNNEGIEKYYYPTKDILGSYTSIIGGYDINDIGSDMYSYMVGKPEKLRWAYYMALGRERWSSFNINNINYELNGNNGNKYFLEDY